MRKIVSLLLICSFAMANDYVLKADNFKFSIAPEQNFDGIVKVAKLPSNSKNINISLVEFEKGAKTAWHSHPKGQVLIVTQGEGLTQIWGEEIMYFKKGDVINCPPNTKHWHGASKDSTMSHISIVESENGKSVNWFEKVKGE